MYEQIQYIATREQAMKFGKELRLGAEVINECLGKPSARLAAHAMFVWAKKNISNDEEMRARLSTAINKVLVQEDEHGNYNTINLSSYC